MRNIKYFDGPLFFERDLLQFNHLIIAKKPVHFFNGLNAHSVVWFSGILGYKIHFDSNGDAEFNLTLLNMQLVGMQVFCQFFVPRKA